MTPANVGWLLAGWIATNAVLAVAWAWWRQATMTPRSAPAP